MDFRYNSSAKSANSLLFLVSPVAAKSLYDILEVSPSATPEAIRAAYERLSGKYDPFNEEAKSIPDIRIQYEAVKEAFLTLGSPDKRAKYDRDLARRRASEAVHVAPKPPATYGTWIFVLVMTVFTGSAWMFYEHRQNEKRLAAERQLAETRAREAEELARLQAAERKADRERAMAEARRPNPVLSAESRARMEHEANLRRYAIEQGHQGMRSQYSSAREAEEQRRAAERARREEQQAVSAARTRAAQEREELCRIERERYGRAISC